MFFVEGIILDMDEKQSEEEVLPNYYAVIPAEVRYHPDLTWFDKCLYGEVSALASKKGYCWAKNTYFSHVLGVGVRTLQLGLKRLVKAGLLIFCLWVVRMVKDKFIFDFSILLEPEW